MALIMDCIAMKIFWYTILMKPLLSASEYPDPWIILICLMKVLLPLSPVPAITTDNFFKILIKCLKTHFQVVSLDFLPDAKFSANFSLAPQKI